MAVPDRRKRGRPRRRWMDLLRENLKSFGAKEGDEIERVKWRILSRCGDPEYGEAERRRRRRTSYKKSEQIKLWCTFAWSVLMFCFFLFASCCMIKISCFRNSGMVLNFFGFHQQLEIKKPTVKSFTFSAIIR